MLVATGTCVACFVRFRHALYHHYVAACLVANSGHSMVQAELTVRGTTATLQDQGFVSCESSSVAPVATEALSAEGMLSEGDIAAALTKHAPSTSQGALLPVTLPPSNKHWARSIPTTCSLPSQAFTTAKPKRERGDITADQVTDQVTVYDALSDGTFLDHSLLKARSSMLRLSLLLHADFVADTVPSARQARDRHALRSFYSLARVMQQGTRTKGGSLTSSA